MALGVACAGTGNKEAVALLEPMLSDSTSYVRQGAQMALAMVLIQHNELTSPKVLAQPEPRHANFFKAPVSH